MIIPRTFRFLESLIPQPKKPKRSFSIVSLSHEFVLCLVLLLATFIFDFNLKRENYNLIIIDLNLILY